MTINEVMKFGCDGMDRFQIMEERARRIAVVERINKVGSEMERAKACKKIVPTGGDLWKMYDRLENKTKKELNRIKGAENVWLRHAAWFMYV